MYVSHEEVTRDPSKGQKTSNGLKEGSPRWLNVRVLTRKGSENK